MKIAIIGAGGAGLASARHVTAEGMDCDILEMGSELGGVWVYTDDIKKDKNGFPVYSAMYQNLTTNLPKELMSFPDFRIPEQDASYLSQPEILKYLNSYTDHFNLRHLIKFNRMVTDVRPINDDKWQIKSLDKCTKQEIVDIYDSVMICCGIFNEPNMQAFPGEEKFSGRILHSSHFRSKEPYRNQRVLIIGGGPSGLDLVTIISSVAAHIVFSHHIEKTAKLETLPNVSMKPDVFRIKNDKEVEFVDGSSDTFDTIIYCTGYNYSFPFLHSSCGITIDDNFIQPLYKHVINIERPTMCFIGMPFYCCHFLMFDIQARFYCKYLNGSMKLPTQEIMRKEVQEEMNSRFANGYNKRKAHFLGLGQQNYFDDLTSTAKITPVNPVVNKLWVMCVERLFENFLTFRKERYRLIDEENFIRL